MSVVPDLLTKTVKKYPDRTAVVEGEKSVTYGTLYSMVEGFSSFLKSRGVGHGDRVAILLPNSIEYIVCFFGIARLGAISVPINAAYKQEEINFYISDSSPRIMLTDETLKQLAEKTTANNSTRVFVIKGDKADWSYSNHYKSNDIDNSIEPNDEAIFLYSTGSTGKPKRVSRSHYNLVALADNHTQTVGWTEEDKILFTVPLQHTYALGNFISGIKVGTSLYVLGTFNRNKVIDLIEGESITVFPAVPFMLNVLAETYLKKPGDFSSLRLVISAGSPLSKEVFHKFHEKFGIYPRQLYGSTETGVISINLCEDIEDKSDSVGRAVKNVEVKIFREDGSVANTNELGEIAVKSPSMADGYDGLPDETSKVFRGGYYFTGDLGLIDEDGYIKILGRKKQFINISGNKVNPREVENLIIRHSKVKEIAVFGFKDSKGNELVKAVIVPKKEMNMKEVFDFCQGRIADYKIPRIIEFRKSIPKSPTGKVLIGSLQ